MEPATKRGFPGVENSSAARRASAAACLFSACASAASPYSPSTRGVPPKLLVSTMSEPASKYFRWTSSTTSGRVRTRFSLQPSRETPPKSAAERLRCCSMVPIAPSRTSMRSAKSPRRARSDSFRFLIRDLSFNSSVGAIFPAIWPAPLALIVYVPLPSESNPQPGGARRRPAGKLACGSWPTRPNKSVTTREHLSARSLPVFPAFTTLEYSGEQKHALETYSLSPLAAPPGAERIRTPAIQGIPIQGHLQATGIHARARFAQLGASARPGLCDRRARGSPSYRSAADQHSRALQRCAPDCCRRRHQRGQQLFAASPWRQRHPYLR